jgi:hypothetical protein
MNSLGLQRFQECSGLKMTIVHILYSGIYPTKLLFSQLQGKQKNIYEYLASAQQTKYAVIPLHTEDGFNLFHEAVKVGGIWAAPTGLPNFDNMATWWSSKANGKTIFYKLREHLATYYKIWSDKRKQNEAMVASLPVRKKNDSRWAYSTCTTCSTS